MKTITLQEVLDKNYEWFVVKKQPRSMDINYKRCAYRGADGAQCAIGCVIPDSLYDPNMEDGLNGIGTFLSGFETERQPLVEFFKDIPVSALQELQSIHDVYYGQCSYRFDLYMDKNLRLFAKTHNLNYPNENHENNKDNNITAGVR